MIRVDEADVFNSLLAAIAEDVVSRLTPAGGIKQAQPIASVYVLSDEVFDEAALALPRTTE
jgi:hypothetical protein